MSLKGVRKFKRLRLILVNSQVCIYLFIYFYDFCVNCCICMCGTNIVGVVFILWN